MVRRLLGSFGVATVLAIPLIPASDAQSLIKTVPGVTSGTGANGYVQSKTPDGQPDRDMGNILTAARALEKRAAAEAAAKKGSN
jgi:hypothetical protein